MEDQGITLEADGNSQKIFTKLNGSADKTLEMLGYAAGILLHPDLSLEEFEKMKKLLTNNPDGVQEPARKESISEKIDNEWLKGSPYLYKEGNLKELEFEDVKNLHKEILKNAQGTVFITIPQEELTNIKSEIFKILMNVVERMKLLF